jgi:AcrR family transcriptional regulator
MPRPVNPTLKSDLIDAAIVLLETSGPSFSMRDLSASIGYSTTAVYRCFSDRADLLRAMQIRLFEGLAAELMPPFDEGEVVPQIVALGAAFVQWGVRHPVRYEFMFHNPQPEALLSETERVLVMGPLWALEALIERAVQVGELSLVSPKTVALMMFSSVHGLVSLHLAQRLDGHTEAELGQLYNEWVQVMLGEK